MSKTPAPPAPPKGPVLVVSTVIEPKGDERALAKTTHAAVVDALHRTALHGRRVRLTIHAEVLA